MQTGRSISAISPAPICRAIAMPVSSGSWATMSSISAAPMNMAWRSPSAPNSRADPKEHVDLFHAINKAFFDKLEFSFDHYSRTTWPGHVPTAQEFLPSSRRKGVDRREDRKPPLFRKEKRFLADRYVVGTCPKCGYEEARGDECQRCASSYEATDLKNPRSKLTGSPLVLQAEQPPLSPLRSLQRAARRWISRRTGKRTSSISRCATSTT